MKLALFGGSFSPVHFGHYEIVREVDKQFSFQKIIIIPAFRNPFKENQPIVPPAIRLRMLEQTFSEFSNVLISDYELKKKQTSYTYQTLEHFKKLYPRYSLYLVIGEDSFATFHLWMNADRIMELSHLLVFHRPDMETRLSSRDNFSSTGKVQWIDAKIPRISSSQIRQADFKTASRNGWLHKNALLTWQNFTSDPDKFHS